jgi:GNAT superfamily N-acetyltransferase
MRLCVEAGPPGEGSVGPNGPPRAGDGHQPVAYDPSVEIMLVGPASEDAARIVRDERTASISGAFVRPEHRRAGVADALLDAAVSWARDGGYERLAVDFETANLLATRFWTRHFRPVTYSLCRRL